MMVLFNKKSENGSYTIEACISLVVFLVAIMFIYSQIKTIICESIMQHAVNNMASEMSTYVYVLDRAGLIIDNDDRFKESDALIEQAGGTAKLVKGNIDKFTGLYTALEDGDLKGASTTVGEISGDAGSMVDSVNNLVNSIKETDWGKLAKNGGIAAGENIIKMLANTGLAEFYKWKLSAYLPTDLDTFCEKYLVEKDSIDFSYSRVFPNSDNNTIVVAVKYNTKPAFRMFPVKRKVVKAACTAAWVDSNTNKIKKDDAGK